MPEKKIQFVFQQATGFFIRKDFFRCSCLHAIYLRLAKVGSRRFANGTSVFFEEREVFADERKEKALGFLEPLVDGIIAAWSVVLPVSVNPDNIIAEEKGKKIETSGKGGNI